MCNGPQSVCACVCLFLRATARIRLKSEHDVGLSYGDRKTLSEVMDCDGRSPLLSPVKRDQRKEEEDYW